MSERKPKVSIVIPTYNMQEHLGETIDSILSQTLDSYEVIIVDDCSTDGTAQVALKYCEIDSRIRYVKLDANSNLPAVPRNRGIELSQGEYIAFLDHDDLWSPRKLERQIAFLDTHPNFGMVHSHLFVFTPRNRYRGILHLPNPLLQRTNQGVLATRNTVQTSSVVVRRSILQELKGFDERPELRTVEDFHLWIRVSRTTTIAYLSEIQGRYRKADSGASAQENLMKRHEQIDLFEGTSLVSHSPSFQYRLRRKVFGWPVAAYCFVIEAPLRKLFNFKPRVL